MCKKLNRLAKKAVATQGKAFFVQIYCKRDGDGEHFYPKKFYVNTTQVGIYQTPVKVGEDTFYITKDEQDRMRTQNADVSFEIKEKPDDQKGIKEKPDEKENTDTQQWTCQRCTVTNGHNQETCGMCNSRRDGKWVCLICKTVNAAEYDYCQGCTSRRGQNY